MEWSIVPEVDAEEEDAKEEKNMTIYLIHRLKIPNNIWRVRMEMVEMNQTRQGGEKQVMEELLRVN